MINYQWEPLYFEYAKKINWALVGREIGLISRDYFAKVYGNCLFPNDFSDDNFR